MTSLQAVHTRILAHGEFALLVFVYRDDAALCPMTCLGDLRSDVCKMGSFLRLAIVPVVAVCLIYVFRVWSMVPLVNDNSRC